jgi:hypothetical protein
MQLKRLAHINSFVKRSGVSQLFVGQSRIRFFAARLLLGFLSFCAATRAVLGQSPRDGKAREKQITMIA